MATYINIHDTDTVMTLICILYNEYEQNTSLSVFSRISTVCVHLHLHCKIIHV